MQHTDFHGLPDPNDGGSVLSQKHRLKFSSASDNLSGYVRKPTPAAHLLGRDQQDLMASLLDALLGAGDADVGAGVVGAWNSDLGGGLQLQLLQLLAVLADDEAVVLLGDGDRGRRLGGRRRKF